MDFEAKLPSPVQILLNAQSAVTQKIKLYWLVFLRTALVPAVLAAGLSIWLAEAYSEAAPYVAGQWAVLIAAGAAVVALSSLAIGRMVRQALLVEAPPTFIKGLAITADDRRFLLAGFGMLGLALLVAATEGQAHRLVEAAFIAPGSEAIERPVLAFTHMAFILGLAYLLGRYSIFLAAAALPTRYDSVVLWNATEGHAAILFIVCIAVPGAAFYLMIAPLLHAGAIFPWPEPGDFNAAHRLVETLRSQFYLIGLAAFFGVLAGWALMAAGIAAAWEALQARGTIKPVGAPAF